MELDNCCSRCFNDNWVETLIRKSGSSGTCHFCNKTRRYCIDARELSDLFQPLVDLYVPVENFMALELLKTYEGDHIWEKLHSDWDVFSHDDPHVQERLLRAIFWHRRSVKEPEQFLESWVEMDPWGGIDDASEEVIKQWELLCSEIKTENRFFPEKTIHTEMLSSILSILSNNLPAGNYYYRSRKSSSRKKLKCSEMGSPPQGKSPDGRANPHGISYLYLSSDPQTAIAESRPFIGDVATVGRFKIKKKQTIVDLRDPHIDSPFRFGDELNFAVQHLEFLRMLGSELSKPINRNDNVLDYVPLQYLCEFIKHDGYDGIIYSSSLGQGYNITLFRETDVKCTRTYLWSIKGVNYSLDQI